MGLGTIFRKFFGGALRLKPVPTPSNNEHAARESGPDHGSKASRKTDSRRLMDKKVRFMLSPEDASTASSRPNNHAAGGGASVTGTGTKELSEDDKKLLHELSQF